MFFRSVFFSIGSAILLSAVVAQAQTRTITAQEYRDKMAAGWIGQMAGVSQGAPTEFRWGDKIIPQENMPVWNSSLINQAFAQDDLYVEMTFLRTLEVYGLDCSIRVAGIDFANSGYPLWCANDAGRKNLRLGIAPPDSSHPQFNKCPNDIDYQIEADYSGLIAPGIPQAAVDLGEKFGRLMNYGDGLYAGQFMGALYAEAFFESQPVKLVETALKAIPAESQYAEMVRDMLAWYQEDSQDWQGCWQKCQKKYRENPDYQKASNGGIDCKINGAYVLMGLLYGKRDLNETIVISTRCGHDSDCNPSSSAGVLFTTIGYSHLPETYVKDLQWKPKFSHTEYDFQSLLNVCDQLARKIVVKYGGKVTKNSEGQEIFVIPTASVKPSKLVYSWDPEPSMGVKYSPEEMAKMTWNAMPIHMQHDVESLFPGWTINQCGQDMSPGIREDWQGEKKVLCVHPLDSQTGCVLSKTVAIPSGKTTTLRYQVGNDPQGDFDLIIRVAGKEVQKKAITNQTTTNHWFVGEVDLTPFAGQEVKVELVDQPSGWAWEAAYWKKIEIESK